MIKWEIFYILKLPYRSYLHQIINQSILHSYNCSASGPDKFNTDYSQLFIWNIPECLISQSDFIRTTNYFFYYPFTLQQITLFKQGNMATQIQVYQDFPSIHQNLSQVSTQSDEQILNFCRHKCFQNSSKIRGTNNHKVKSSLCKNFAQTGLCPYGDKCQFAHGTHELRCNAQVNISYKTKYCNSFLNKKCCIYGFRCNFIHKNNAPVDEEQKWRTIYSNHRETIAESTKNEKSRLLKLLGNSTL